MSHPATLGGIPGHGEIRCRKPKGDGLATCQGFFECDLERRVALLRLSQSAESVTFEGWGYPAGGLPMEVIGQVAITRIPDMMKPRVQIKLMPRGKRKLGSALPRSPLKSSENR